LGQSTARFPSRNGNSRRATEYGVDRSAPRPINGCCAAAKEIIGRGIQSSWILRCIAGAASRHPDDESFPGSRQQHAVLIPYEFTSLGLFHILPRGSDKTATLPAVSTPSEVVAPA